MNEKKKKEKIEYQEVGFRELWNMAKQLRKSKFLFDSPFTILIVVTAGIIIGYVCGEILIAIIK